jgi:ribosomal protein S18 acetylase RimI-like enzyme
VPTELERAVAFEERVRELCAERTVPFRFGVAFFNDTFPSTWYLNSLRVEETEGLTAPLLAAEAERLHAEAGHAHRSVAVPDEATGAALAPGFRDLGWDADHLLFMAYRGPGERDGDTAAVEEVPGDVLVPFREVAYGDEPWATSEEDVRMVVAGNAFQARVAGARHFAVREGGIVVSAADLYEDGRTAQVEDVATLGSERGRGHASAVTLRAVEEALADGNDLVFLVADAEDWPKELYGRLGFEPIGEGWTFLRKPAPADPG